MNIGILLGIFFFTSLGSALSAERGVLTVNCEGPVEHLEHRDGTSLPLRVPQLQLLADFDRGHVQMRRAFQYLPPFDSGRHDPEMEKESYSILKTRVAPRFPEGCTRHCDAKAVALDIRLSDGHAMLISAARPDRMDRQPMSSQFTHSWIIIEQDHERLPPVERRVTDRWENCKSRWL